MCRMGRTGRERGWVAPQLMGTGVVALYGPAEGLGDVFDHGGEAEGAEGAEREAADHGVVAGAVALEGVDAHDGEVRLGVRVVA